MVLISFLSGLRVITQHKKSGLLNLDRFNPLWNNVNTISVFLHNMFRLRADFEIDV